MEINGYITIGSAGKNRPHLRQIHSNSNFFTPNEEVIVKLFEDKIVFRKPSIDYNGKTHKPQRNGSGDKWINLFITGELPFGRFDFEPDESNIDCLVVYFK